MDYDFRNTVGPPYGGQIPAYRQPVSSSPTPSAHPMYAYPRVGQSDHSAVPPIPRTFSSSSSHSSSPTSSSSSGMGIKVALKPEYRITPPPQLLPLAGNIPRSNFHYNFELEWRIMDDVEKGSQNWSRLGLDNLLSNAKESPTSSVGSVADPVVGKYIASGLNREAVPIAVTNYGDNPTKVREFVNGFNLLREMGFSSSNVAEALLMYDNDTDKALSHFLNNSS